MYNKKTGEKKLKINLKTVTLVSATAILSAFGASKCTSAVAECDRAARNCVKVLNPNRYNEIIKTGKQNDPMEWNKALEEITDTLRKLNSDAEKGYFRANQLLKDTTKTALKSVK